MLCLSIFVSESTCSSMAIPVLFLKKRKEKEEEEEENEKADRNKKIELP